MPNGFTAELYKGSQKGLDVKKFIIKVARSYGFLNHLRENQAEFYTKEELMPKKDDFLENKVLEYSTLVKKFEKMSEDDIQKEYEKEKQNLQEQANKKQKERDKVTARYDAMLKAIQDWKANKDVEFVKEGCIDAIENARVYDMQILENELETFKSAKEWHTKKLKELKRDLEYYKEEYKREMENFENVCKLINSLFECMPNLTLSEDLSE